MTKRKKEKKRKTKLVAVFCRTTIGGIRWNKGPLSSQGEIYLQMNPILGLTCHEIGIKEAIRSKIAADSKPWRLEYYLP